MRVFLHAGGVAPPPVIVLAVPEESVNDVDPFAELPYTSSVTLAKLGSHAATG
jgi:hypothetical protein